MANLSSFDPMVHNPKGGVLAGYLPTWVGILLAVGGAEIFARHGDVGVVGYEWLAGLNLKNIDFSKSNFENWG